MNEWTNEWILIGCASSTHGWGKEGRFAKYNTKQHNIQTPTKIYNKSIPTHDITMKLTWHYNENNIFKLTWHLN